MLIISHNCLFNIVEQQEQEQEVVVALLVYIQAVALLVYHRGHTVALRRSSFSL